MMPPLQGRAAFIFAEPNFDVDRILVFDAMRSHDLAAMQASAMRDFDPAFQEQVRPGDLLIGGPNFGYGHPHGPPMEVMRRLGIAAVIAESFAPLYLMGEIAAGFPQITCPGILAETERWDELAVDWREGLVRNLRSGRPKPFRSLTMHQSQVIQAGGLLALLRQAERRRTP